ncbi:BON domain-containing protein [Caldimonas sp. KR1-144]|uniref:BON domain-containing protein n=1 Tax=Caldimonas sp. KR1-144 TaxID=3400911 RepID=UPI003C04E7A9
MNARTTSRPLTALSAVAALLAATTLGACNRADDSRTAGERVDSATASAERKMDDARQEANQAAGEIKSEAKQAANDIKSSVSDATITASVNAKLAADKELSALRINVDTSDGRVALRGTAPNLAARDRATQIAAAVEGVRSVDNQLQIRSS